MQKLESEHHDSVKKIHKEIESDLKQLESIGSRDEQTATQFVYNYLNHFVTNSSFSRIFEMANDTEYFYVFAQNNKKMNNQNKRNPFYAEISLTRVSQETYLEVAAADGAQGRRVDDRADQSTDLRYQMQRSLPEVCLHDFIPGMVQKVAFD